jgi:hypothetical protein
MDEETRRRVERVAETILENERLTAELDDQAADFLLDWGVAWAKMIAQRTAGLGEPEADEIMDEPLRALRGLLRSVNRWVSRASEMDEVERATLLTQMVEQVATICGSEGRLPDDEQQAAFLQEHASGTDNPPHMIARLRELFEGPK